MSKYQIVYSKKLTELLMERGFIFDKVAPNPQYPQYNCWLFENTDEFRKVFEELVCQKDR